MIYVITGAPCSGKSTYIQENAKQGDIVLDMDELAVALTFKGEMHNCPDYVNLVAMAARKGALSAAVSQHQAKSGFDVYIIHTDPSLLDRRNYRAFSARIIELDPGLQTCLDRLKLRPVKNQQKSDKAIRDYYAAR